MSSQKYPRGWNRTKVQRLIEHYDSQTDEQVAAEIEAGLNSTTVEVPRSLVPAVRELIAKRTRARAKKTHGAKLQRTNHAGGKTRLRKPARTVGG